MNEQILQLIADYGLEATVIALVINVLTGIIKLPIKLLASKMQDGSQLTKYLVFLPILLGFAVTMGYMWLMHKKIAFDYKFISMWLSGSTLSLSLYAIFEKIFPSKRKILEKHEMDENKQLIQQLEQLFIEKNKQQEMDANQEVIPTSSLEQKPNKLILNGNISQNIRHAR